MVALCVVAIVVVALLAFLVAGLLRSNAEITRALHSMGVDLSPGAEQPGVTTPVAMGGTRAAAAGTRPTPAGPRIDEVVDLAGTTPTGDAISLAVTGVRHDTLVAFLTSGCSTCRVFWDAFKDGVHDVPGGARLVAVTRGSDGESPGAIAQLAGPHVPIVMSSEVWQTYDIPYAPYFVYVSGPRSEVIGEGVAASWEEIKGMLETAVADLANPVAPTVDVEQRWEQAGTAPGGSGRQPMAAADAERADRIDRELSAAGILPGDPRLHHHGSLGEADVVGPPPPNREP